MIRAHLWRRAPIALLILVAGGVAQAQDLPGTRVWLVTIQAGLPADATLISKAAGYNNQPLFSPDGRYIYFTAEQGDGQTDIARHELDTGATTVVAVSPESEYSPTPIPGQAALSVVRVEPDGRQRLWRLDLSGGTFSLLLPNVEPVGYHCWYAPGRVALFVLGDSFTLQRASVGEQPSNQVFDNIGRTLRGLLPSDEVLFVDKNTSPWSIAAIDMQGGETRAILALFPGIEDFEVDLEGRFWMGSGSKLYRSDPANRRWELTGDLREHGITGITRLGSSPDGTLLAVVSSP